ncbi:MAG TPA: DUF3467 domain-containing protein [Candidatus Onthomorpha intestinigallinarum]|uniref:DUF3467 domain-containing protein n=1 Tax=Candidatus Onthomorpha intestinigallinarum TaxID=2840880 RepID=A0A9D1RHZ9_9BACT|nr:DUF3467 domain-containing protein [Candidatus Onthomorpha intestinigallinarum]
MEQQEEKKGQLDIELTPDVAQGVYSNLQLIQHSPTEFVLDFIQIMPGVPKAQVKSRVILSPIHAKKLLSALQDNINKYERTHGTISDMQASSSYEMINPMGKA